MIYYTKDSKKIDFNLNNLQNYFIDLGKQSYVFMYDDNECIKFYYSEQPRGLNIYTKTTFEFFKSLALENYCELHQEFYRNADLKKIGAYTMEYYPRSETSILEMPIEYILYNLEIQYQNAMILSENKILMNDLHKKNIIIGDDNMTVIDFESYYKEPLQTYKNLLRKNTIILLETIKSIYLEELNKINKNNKNSIILLEDLFSYNKEPVKKLSKKLHGVKKSIELFK